MLFDILLSGVNLEVFLYSFLAKLLHVRSFSSTVYGFAIFSLNWLLYEAGHVLIVPS